MRREAGRRVGRKKEKGKDEKGGREESHLHTRFMTYRVSARQGVLLNSNIALLTTKNLVYSCTCRRKQHFNHKERSLFTLLQPSFLSLAVP